MSKFAWKPSGEPHCRSFQFFRVETKRGNIDSKTPCGSGVQVNITIPFAIEQRSKLFLEFLEKFILFAANALGLTCLLDLD